MGEIGGTDGDHVNAIVARGFARDHGGVIVVGAFRRDKVLRGKTVAALGVNIECARHQLELIVQAGGEAVDPANISASTAADHPQPNTPAFQ